jgi:raffinose/stachyose/melibiose transport system permease protein
MFNLFYAYYGGMFNQILGYFEKAPINWKSDSLALGMIAIPIIWSYVGFYFILMLTGINSISEEIFESAMLDGATGFKKIYYITLPLLKNVMRTSIILAITGALKVFDLPWVMTPKGAPKGLTHFAGTYMYQVTFIEENIDYGSAIALIIVVAGIMISQGANQLLKQEEL